MKVLDSNDRQTLCLTIDNWQKSREDLKNGFLKWWKIDSMVSQVNDYATHKMDFDSIGFFRNCMEMEGFTEDGIQHVHNMVMRAFNENDDQGN